MARYIDLDDDGIVYCGNDGDYDRYNIPTGMPSADVPDINVGDINKLPSADVVKVVRCRDCKYCAEDTIFKQWFCINIGTPTKAGDFCNYGVRKDG